MAGTIICYGDSNTYGYDPRSFLGGRYREDVRWPEILNAETDWTVLNYGQNGRCTPYFLPDIEYVINRLPQWAKEKEPVWLWVMLGTNDLLHNPLMTAESVTERMERFLKKLTACEEIASGEDEGRRIFGEDADTPAGEENGGGKIRLRLISPVHLSRGQWVETDERCRESEKLDELYQKLAERLGIAFTCAGKWDIPVLFDGVHFSEEGNRKFADCIKNELRLQG